MPLVATMLPALATNPVTAATVASGRPRPVRCRTVAATTTSWSGGGGLGRTENKSNNYDASYFSSVVSGARARIPSSPAARSIITTARDIGGTPPRARERNVRGNSSSSSSSSGGSGSSGSDSDVKSSEKGVEDEDVKDWRKDVSSSSSSSSSLEDEVDDTMAGPSMNTCSRVCSTYAPR